MHDSLALDQFLQHGVNKELRMQLRLFKPKTLSGAIQNAIELEILHKIESGTSAVSSNCSPSTAQPVMGPSNCDVMEAIDQLRREVSELKGLSGNKRFNRPIDGPDRGYNRSNTKCWKCERFGHTKYECKSQKATQSPRSVAYYQPSGAYNGNKPERGTLQAVGCSYFLPIHIGDVPCDLLIDCGAQVSIIHKRVWDQINSKNPQTMQTCHTMLKVANGGTMHVIGKWKTVVTIQNLHLAVEFVVAKDALQDALAGTDFLQQYAGTINIADRSCTLMGRKFSLIASDDGAQIQRVVVDKNTVIPPRSEVIIPGKVEGQQYSGKEVFLEPVYNDKSELIIGRSLGCSQHGQVPVRVANVTSEPQVMYSGTLLGILHHDISVAPSNLITNLKSPNVQTTGFNSSHNNHCTWTSDQLKNELGLDNRGLDNFQIQNAINLLMQYECVFSSGDNDLGCTTAARHHIDTRQAPPIRMGPRRIPIHFQKNFDDQLHDLCSRGLVSPSSSPWAAPVVLVKKKDGGVRLCVDYRKLNDITVKDAYPLPRIDDTLDLLSNARWFSTLDLTSGYWQVEVHPADRHKTAFVTSHGLFQINVMPFGLCNAPSTFQRLMDIVLADLQGTACLVYLDDIIVIGRTWDEHLQRLSCVLQKLKEAKLKVKPSKCKLFCEKVRYLGHVISSAGVEPDPEKVTTITQWPVPQNIKELRSFLGLASYYRKFIEGFAHIADPLHKLAEKGAKFIWSKACGDAFLELKRRLLSAPIMAYPDPQLPFILDTDASETGIGAVLSQIQDGHERVISYASRALTKPERKYATTRKELLAVVIFTRYYRHYLLGRHFTVRTDHNSLKWLHTFHEPEGQLARWLEQLSMFDYVVEHRAGRHHQNADALSRRPYSETQSSTSEPPSCSAENSITQPVHVTPVDLKSAQDLDNDICQLKEWIMAGETSLPTEAHSSPHQNVFRKHWSNLSIRSGLLVRKTHGDDPRQAKFQIVVPRRAVPVILEMLHNDKTGGHLGVYKVTGKVIARYFWPSWRKDVKAWCKTCTICGARKNEKKTARAPMVSSQTDRPLQRVALDILVPLPETHKGNKYILVIGDYFSKWAEGFPLPGQEAKTVTKTLVEDFICHYGVPRSLHTDQGRNFESKVFKDMCSMLGIHKTRTTPYHPQSDGFVERFNRTLLTMLSSFVEDHQRDWDDILPYVMMTYRSTVQSSTGYSPFMVMFGREVCLPVDLVNGGDVDEKFTSPTSYVSEVARRLAGIRNMVKYHQAKATGKQKEYYDLKITAQVYEPGENVWVRDSTRKKGVCPKLRPKYKGPYVIAQKLSDVLYRVCDTEGKHSSVQHYARLKPFFCPWTQLAEQPPTQDPLLPDQLPTGESAIPLPDEDSDHSNSNDPQLCDVEESNDSSSETDGEEPLLHATPMPDPTVSPAPQNFTDPPNLQARPQRQRKAPKWHSDYCAQITRCEDASFQRRGQCNRQANGDCANATSSLQMAALDNLETVRLIPCDFARGDGKEEGKAIRQGESMHRAGSGGRERPPGMHGWKKCRKGCTNCRFPLVCH
uniref:Gypsy retrotransposon integrase-like protein 1 n=1 Tax=Xenopus tropicalis TaxID=8364 RepID=A0A803JFV2_XENTR